MNKVSVRVLMLDDNAVECRLVEEMLSSIEHPHFEIHNVAKLEDAYQALAQGACDIVILDLMLGESQGIETLKSIRAVARHIPVVVLTMIADETIGLQAMQEGAQDYLIKTQVDAPLLSRSLLYALERAKNQEELRIASLEWDRTFNAIDDSIMLIDRDFRIKRVNKATLTLFALTQEDIVGRKCYEVFHRMDKPWPGCPFGQTQIDYKTHATEIFNSEANTCFLVSVSPILDNTGQLVGTVHVTRDISELKKAERSLERRVNDLEVFLKAAVDRELVMVQLKKRLREMEAKVTQDQRAL